MFVPRLGDLYGRKKPFIVSVLAAALLYLGVLFTYDWNMIIVLFFLLGMTQAGKYSMAHVYLQELMPHRYRSLAGIFVQFADSFSLIFVSLYNRFVSKDWMPFQILGVTLTFVSFFALVIIPDSPKYLYSKGRFQDARSALEWILRFNRCCKRKNFKNDGSMVHIKFDSEIVHAHHESDVTKSEEKVIEGKLRDLFKDR